MRWGLMSLIVLVAWKIFARRAPAPPPAANLDRHRAGGARLRGRPPAGADGQRRRYRLAAAFPHAGLERASLGLLFGWLFATRDLESPCLPMPASTLALVPLGR